MEHELHLSEEVVGREGATRLEVINVKYLELESLPIFEAILNLEVLDKFWVQAIVDHLCPATLHPATPRVLKEDAQSVCEGE